MIGFWIHADYGFTHPMCDDWIWKAILEQNTPKYQLHIWLQNNHVNEESGYLAICAQVLWQTVVHWWTDTTARIYHPIAVRAGKRD